MLFYAVALENALTSELIDMALNVKRKKNFKKMCHICNMKWLFNLKNNLKDYMLARNVMRLGLYPNCTAFMLHFQFLKPSFI